MTRDDASPWLARGIYLFGLGFVLTAGIDLFTTVWPMRPGDMAWRYGFLGLAAGYLQTPTLGLLLVMLAAWWQRNATMLKITAVLALVAALAMIPAMGLFALDVLAMRQLRAADMQTSVLAGGLFQEVKYGVATLVLLLLGYGALKTAKSMRGSSGGGGRPGILSSRQAG